MDTLEAQRQKIIAGIIADGSIYRGLEDSMQKREQDGYFLPWHVNTAYRIVSKWGTHFDRDYSLQKRILDELQERNEIIFYNRKDVGALIRFKGGNYPSCILVDYLIAATNKMNLDNAQINELERLLNKANRTLGVTLPPVPKPTDAEMQDALRHLMLEVIKSKPKHFHQRYLDALSAQGSPVEMNSKDFHEFAEKTLTP